MALAWDKHKVGLIWRKGGNWAVFLLFWMISSAVMSMMEHSDQNEELTQELDMTTQIEDLKEWINGMKEHHGKNDTVINGQTEKLIKLLQNPEAPKVWGKIDLQQALVDDNLFQAVVDIFISEFSRIKNEFEENDQKGRQLASNFLQFFSEDDTLLFINKTATNHAKLARERKNKFKKECLEKKMKGLSCEKEKWSFGESLHFTSTVFTATGFGFKSAITSAGKFVTVILIMTQLPFFLHCLATSARNINQLLDKFFGLSDKHEDMDDLTEGGGNESNTRQRRMVMVKGLLVLTGVLAVHMLIASIYTVLTTGWTFGNVLYFQFVNYASIGFGDLIPEDEFTAAGAIFKNLLIKIPAEILTFAMFIRVLPCIS